MVSRRLSRASLALALCAGLILVAPGWGTALPTIDPGPFWPLKLAYADETYQDTLPRGATYTLRSGRFPAGVSLAPDGRVAGTPIELGTFSVVLSARETASGLRYPVRLAMTVRDAEESTLTRATPSFEQRGPMSVIAEDFRVQVTSTFDNRDTITAVRVIRPATGSYAPLLMLHHGRGFDHDDYDDLMEHIASYGIAVASVEDPLSFSGRTFRADVREYDLFRAELGMESASGVVEAVTDLLISRSQDPQDALYEAFSADDIFFAGHSRGGGAVHASHERSFELRLKGLIYLMAFDLRYFRECAPPGRAPAYPIFDASPRTPSLIVAAENDGDLTYPIADQIIDRATGPATQVTVYGAVHNLISDAAPAEGDDRISRRSEQRQVADWIVCFIKRWAGLGDASLDRRLYTGGHSTSGDAAIAGWYPSPRTLVVEDAQDNDPDRNRRGQNLVLDLRRSEDSIYPGVGDLDSLALRHTLLTPTSDVTAWRMASDTLLDVSTHARLAFRATQTSRHGWAWAGVWVRLLDDQGGVAWARVHEPGAAGSLLPAPNAQLSPHQRFLDVHLDLADDFGSSGQPLDRSRVTAVDLFLVVRDAQRQGSMVVDLVRFE
jgi:hypothetical protein